MNEDIRKHMNTSAIWYNLYQIDVGITQFGTGWETDEGTLIHHTGEGADVHYCTTPNAADLVTDELVSELNKLLDDEEKYVERLVGAGVLQVLHTT